MHLIRLLPWAALALSATCTPFAMAADDIRAITEDGRRVLLSPDGKWQFDGSPPAARKPAEAVSPYQTAVKRFSVAFNVADWNPAPRKETDESNKRMFHHKRLPVFAMVIADEMPATTPAMKQVIFANARSAGATTTVLVDQTQEVSGKEVGVLRLAATMQGLDFVFSSLYYADDSGNIQVTCYTAQALFHKYQAECQKFIGGLSIK
jgi:hypothetical protein